MQNLNKATSLQTQILAVNTLYKLSKEIIKKEIEFFTPLIGKDVFKVSGELKAKYKHEMEQYKYKVNEFNFDFWVNCHYYLTLEYNKLIMKVICTVSGGGYDKNGVNCNHSQHTQSFDLFDLDKDYKIISICNVDREYLNTVFNEWEILQQAKKAEEVKKEYQNELSKVPSYFRSTLYL